MAKQTPSRKPAGAEAAPKASKAGSPANSTKPKGGDLKPKKSPAGKPAAGTRVSAVSGSAAPKAAKNRPNPARKAPAKSAPKPKSLPRLAPPGDDEPVKMEQSRLTPKELEEFRQMLLAKRQQLVGDVSHLEDEAIHSRHPGSSGSSSMPIHMADIGSDTWEQELTLGLIENERGLLREIDEALERIKDGLYGICMATGKPITKARLRAKPWAKYCIEYARKRELGLAQ